jgi:hypothetical protein
VVIDHCRVVVFEAGEFPAIRTTLHNKRAKQEGDRRGKGGVPEVCIHAIFVGLLRDLAHYTDRVCVLSCVERETVILDG